MSAESTAPASSTPPPEVLSLPPYGVINAENAAYLSTRPVPEGFRADTSSKRPSDATEWEKWIGDLADSMSSFLWPIYKNGKWNGDAKNHGLALTTEDLQLMLRLQAKLDARVGDTSTLTGRHRDAFTQEDDAPPGPSIAKYGWDIPKTIDTEILRATMLAGIEIARPPSQILKSMFQRPRPQLTSLLLGVPDLVVQPSKSAITPSMVSGHCLQGTMVLAQVLNVLANAGTNADEIMKKLSRFYLDTGDRRVLAGLHYPSDNIGSWFVSLRLCKHVFGDKAAEVRDGLWTAIKAYSFVFTAITDAAAVDPKSQYTPLIAKLKDAAEGKE